MEKVTDQAAILTLITQFDNVFDPSLSNDVHDLKTYSEKLTKNAVTFILKEEGTIAGFISFNVRDEKLENSFIVLLAVFPEFQGRKIAQKLLEKCVDESLRRNKKGIKLEVDKSNLTAIRFYEKNHFRVTEETNKGSYYMTRKLL